jgi:hypothetical protein
VPFYIQFLNDVLFQQFPSNSLRWDWLEHELYYLNDVLGCIWSSLKIDFVTIFLEKHLNLLAAYRPIGFFGERQSPKYHLIKSDPKGPHIGRVSGLFSIVANMHFWC